MWVIPVPFFLFFAAIHLLSPLHPARLNLGAPHPFLSQPLLWLSGSPLDGDFPGGNAQSRRLPILQKHVESCTGLDRSSLQHFSIPAVISAKGTMYPARRLERYGEGSCLRAIDGFSRVDDDDDDDDSDSEIEDNVDTLFPRVPKHDAVKMMTRFKTGVRSNPARRPFWSTSR